MIVVPACKWVLVHPLAFLFIYRNINLHYLIQENILPSQIILIFLHCFNEH